MSYQPDQNKTLKPQIWCFPDNVIDPTNDINFIYYDTIKAIWAEIDASGVVVIRNNSSFGSNFYYTAANALLCVQNSNYQYVNVSSGQANMATLCANPTLRANAITALMSFLGTTGFNGGYEVDFEGFGGWTSGEYADYKTFLAEFRTALNAAGYKLMVDAPPIWNDSGTVDPGSPYEWRTRDSQGYYEFKYEEISPLCDYIVPMAYDYEFDLGSGAPNQPLIWLEDIIKWGKLKVYPNSKIVIGLPAAGSSGPEPAGSYPITNNLVFNALSRIDGFSGAQRALTGAPDDSGELIWSDGTDIYSAIDDTAIMLKVNRALAMGINSYSMWFCGYNRYGNPQGKSSALRQNMPVVQTITPTTGNTVVVLLDTTSLIVKPAGTLASLALTLRDGLQDGQVMQWAFHQAIISLTVNGSTLIGTVPNPVAGNIFTFVWSSATESWTFGG